MPLLILHGGPGAASYYVEPLAERLAAHRPTIVYDQLGCGRSDKPDDPSLWTLDRSWRGRPGARRARPRALPPARAVVGRLALGRVLVSRARTGIVGLVLASTSREHPAVHGRGAAADRRAAGAGATDPDRARRPRRATTSPSTGEAVQEFYRRHLCRLDPWPEALQRTADQLDGNQVYLTMNGPTEFDVIGSLRTWDRTGDLRRIASRRSSPSAATTRSRLPARRPSRDGHRRRPHGRLRGDRPLRPPRGAGAATPRSSRAS